jgi:hypothetical protein
MVAPKDLAKRYTSKFVACTDYTLFDCFPVRKGWDSDGEAEMGIIETPELRKWFHFKTSLIKRVRTFRIYKHLADRANTVVIGI